jgi:hypothetical protein
MKNFGSMNASKCKSLRISVSRVGFSSRDVSIVGDAVGADIIGAGESITVAGECDFDFFFCASAGVDITNRATTASDKNSLFFIIFPPLGKGRIMECQ